MVFSSTLFVFIYLPAVLLAYDLTPMRWRNIVLLIVNLIFYGWGEPLYVLLMIASILMDYGFGLAIARDQKQGKKGKAWLTASILINLGLLGYFKYANFFVDNLRHLPGLADLPRTHVVLPIGISFYTFQKMSYVIDVYQGKCPAQRSAAAFGVYVSLFPQLIAGPIVRYKDVAAQLEHRDITTQMRAEGVRQFLAGLCKKVLLANNIGMLWESQYALGVENLSCLGAWLAVAAYTFQIYFDFSGYSDMAIGLGKMLGFTFCRNFNYPYIAASITDFWRRWHISLSSWFREYVYIPLGGNRVSKPRWLLNILLVWMATGFWHGASWNFILWGLYYAVFLIVEKLFLQDFLRRHKVFGHIYTMGIVMLGWALFACENLRDCGAILLDLFGAGQAGLAATEDLYTLSSFGGLFLLCILAALPLGKKWYDNLGMKCKPAVTMGLCAAAMLACTAAMVSSSYNPFLYFRF
jgi:alginate O-acetyltransferase complex protein AlgI